MGPLVLYSPPPVLQAVEDKDEDDDKEEDEQEKEAAEEGLLAEAYEISLLETGFPLVLFGRGHYLDMPG